MHGTFSSVAPDIIDFFILAYPILPMTDYEEQTIATNLIMGTKITAERRIVCYNQTIYNDMRLEVAEYTGLGLVPNTLSTVLTEVEPMYNESSILIIDDDGTLHIITITLCLYWEEAQKMMSMHSLSVSFHMHVHDSLHFTELFYS